MPDWSPATYLVFADERSRPFHDLLARVPVADPRVVVDLGCGPGQLTAQLAARWPGAEVLGVDSSAAMIECARQHAGPGLSFEVGDLSDWASSATAVDVIVSNAAPHWVPGHRNLLPELVGALCPGGVLALQVPGNFEAPSHRLLRELADTSRYREATAAVVWPGSADAADYLTDLAALGCQVDAWETTYLHVLPGEDAVFTWVSGTGARPVLQALAGTDRDAFVTAYREGLRAAYPQTAYGTVLPFRRVFAVARRPAE